MKKKIKLVDLKKFFKGKKVVITGHTGFKGSWLSLTLLNFGAKIYGYSLKNTKHPNNFHILGLKNKVKSNYGDIKNKNKFKKFLDKTKPEILFHLAAQSLVKDSYLDPEETFSTNMIGTLNVLEYARLSKTLKSVVIITSDKCYKNKEFKSGYLETNELGGHDPYSASKAAAENIFYAYDKSFFKNLKKIGVATARAGNVIGGGDWSNNRIIPDCVRSIINNKKLEIRSPLSTRPWQHVLEPLSGYIKLSIELYNQPKKFSSSWNFGPSLKKSYNVKNVIDIFLKKIKIKKKIIVKKNNLFKETVSLQLNCSKARKALNWRNIWNTPDSIKETSDWYKVYIEKGNILKFTKKQINKYFKNGI
jgi:CDP-glucose 4,6-dehydratase